MNDFGFEEAVVRGAAEGGARGGGGRHAVAAAVAAAVRTAASLAGAARRDEASFVASTQSKVDKKAAHYEGSHSELATQALCEGPPGAG